MRPMGFDDSVVGWSMPLWLDDGGIESSADMVDGMDGDIM